MFSRRLKTGYFVLEGLNSFATVYYFYYFYFFMQTEFGFGNKANLAAGGAERGRLCGHGLAGREVCPALRLFHRAQGRASSS